MVDHCAELEPLGSAYVDGELPPTTAAAVEAHLATCSACRDTVEGLTRTRALLRSMPVRRVPPRLLTDVPADAGVDSTVPAAPPPPHADDADPPGRRDPAAHRAARRAPRALTAALAVAGVLGGAAFSLGGEPPDTRTVSVPVDLFVADHVAQARRAPVWSPVLVEAAR